MGRRAYLAALIAALSLLPAPSDAKKAHPGPCRQGQVSSLVDRPGPEPFATNGGSPCTVPKGHVVIEAGYRNDVTVGKGGASNLVSYPMSLLRFGIDKRDELIYIPPTVVVPGDGAAGSLDSGFGWKHNLQSHYWYQDAVEAVVTLPTGTRGESAGAPAYQFSYTGAFSPPGKLGISTTFTLANAPGTPKDGGPPRRFAAYSPSLSLTYALNATTSAVLNDTETLPIDPTGGASNVLLVELQRTLSPGVVVDVESEFNLTPETGYRQHAIGFGGAFLL